MVVVASHSRTLLDQLKIILEDLKSTDITPVYRTFKSLSKNPIEDQVGLLLVDECHRSSSPEYIKLYDNVSYDNILGLSATPTDKSIEKCGDVFIDVGFDEANLCPFHVQYHGILLTGQEEFEYRKLSRLISKFYNDDETNPSGVSLEDIIFKRRGIVYSAENRIDTAMYIINTEIELGRKIAVFCQRKAQANIISKLLVDRGVNHVLYHSDTYSNTNDNDLERYKRGEVRVLVSVGMVREGFDDPDTDCGIVVSTPLTETFHVQTIGRIIRFKPGKQAIIHFILANGTSDLKVVKHSGNYDFDLINIKMPVKSKYKPEYYRGTKYSFRDKMIWQKHGSGMDSYRLYFMYHPILEELRKHKRQGGRFVVTNNGVYIKIKNKIIKISDETPEFEIDHSKKRRSLTEPLTDQEKDEMHTFLEGFSSE